MAQSRETMGLLKQRTFGVIACLQLNIAGVSSECLYQFVLRVEVRSYGSFVQ